MYVPLFILLLYGISVGESTLFPPGKNYYFNYKSEIGHGNSTNNLLSCEGILQSQDKGIVVILDSCIGEEKELLDKLKYPFQFRYYDGLVKDLYFERRDDEISRNLKRAIVGLFQVNMWRIRRENHLTNTMEITPEGECDVFYDYITRGNWTSVFKSINFEKCHTRPDVSYGLRYTVGCPLGKKHQNVRSRTTYNHTLHHGKLVRAEAASEHFITVGTEAILLTKMNAFIHFERVESIDSSVLGWLRLPEQIEPFSLMLTIGVEESREKRWKHIGDRRYHDTSDQKKNLREFLEASTDPIAVKWSTLKKLILACKKDDLIEIGAEVYNSNQEPHIFERGLASAGTVETMKVLIYFWKNGRIPNTHLAMLLKIVHETDYPSLALIKYLEELIISQKEKLAMDEILNQSVWLTMGEIIRGVFGNTLDKMAVREINPSERRRYVSMIVNEFDASSFPNNILFLKVMGNTGLRDFLPTLRKVIQKKNNGLATRIEAVYSLRLIKDDAPYHVQKILLPTYMDKENPSALRMVAFAYFLHTMPNRNLLEVAVSVHETNKEVAAFVYSSLKSLSRSTVPCLTSFVRDIGLTVNHMDTVAKKGKSFYQHSTNIRNELLTGTSLDNVVIYSNNSKYPVHQMSSWEVVAVGNWYQYFLQFGFTQLDEGDYDAGNVLVTMRYKQVDFGFVVLNRTSLEELMTEHKMHHIGALYSEMKLFFSYGPDIKAMTILPTVNGVPITQSAKVSDLMASWLSIRKNSVLQPVAYSTVSYSSDHTQPWSQKKHAFLVPIDTLSHGLFH